MYDVVFRVNASGAVVRKRFTSLYRCRIFVNKLKHSNECSLISYPLF